MLARARGFLALAPARSCRALSCAGCGSREGLRPPDAVAETPRATDAGVYIAKLTVSGPLRRFERCPPPGKRVEVCPSVPTCGGTSGMYTSTRMSRLTHISCSVACSCGTLRSLSSLHPHNPHAIDSLSYTLPRRLEPSLSIHHMRPITHPARPNSTR